MDKMRKKKIWPISNLTKKSGPKDISFCSACCLLPVQCAQQKNVIYEPFEHLNIN
jgi:hypothetical protein